jgi:2-phospho-L-lactate guanylyltransferase (CobY/MobA/RfbA family)
VSTDYAGHSFIKHLTVAFSSGAAYYMAKDNDQILFLLDVKKAIM